MSKLFNLVCVFSLFSISPLAFAEACDSSMGNLGFYSAGIDKKGVSCSYRYCYYGCITNSYKLSGKFKPVGPYWQKSSDDGGYGCVYEGGSRFCQFERK